MGVQVKRAKPGVILAAIVFVLGVSDRAWAWGPAMHVGIADSVLAHLAILPAALAALLRHHRVDYLFGNVAADVVFAKRWSRIKQFCHHWSTAFCLLDDAEDDRARAFAYGYLSHLAADTVAHGKYVPRQVVVSGCSVNYGHFYWELRADALQSRWTRRRLRRVLLADHSRHHQALSCLITDTFLPYSLNRILFDRMQGLAAQPTLQGPLDAWNRHSRWRMSSELLDDYRAECLQRVFAVLTEGARSAVTHEDPNGTSTLMQLQVRRREFRRLRREGLPVTRRVAEVARGFDPIVGMQPGEGRLPPRTPADTRLAVAAG
ncbi:MAG: zinc dependent phospholipase C family protein [Planctomycetes bacterium]|nr:zinc dependent phospholipase C family protein [Planctomycetota bacterium]